MKFTEDELSRIELALKARIFIGQRLPIDVSEETEKDWLLLEKITGKSRFEIAEREK